MNKFFHCLLLLCFFLISQGCSSMNVYENDDIQWGSYGNAWRCSEVHLSNSGNAGVGILNEFTDFLTKPLLITWNTITFRFIWGTNGPGSYFLDIFSLLIPGYSHCDGALWYDMGILSSDSDDD